MKSVKIFASTIITLSLVAFLSMSFTNSTDEATLTALDVEAASPGANTCCPPNWTPWLLFGNDPALKWDKNGDNIICFKGAWVGNSTPNGNGNDPLFTQSNCKDNNNPCDD